jgi:hypothetical protein
MKAKQVNIICPFSRPDQVNNVLENFSRQTFSNKQLIVIENGNALNTFPKDKAIVLTSDNHQSFAKNTGLDYLKSNGGGFWTTFDDDDYYGKNYLQELIDNSDKANIIGKKSFFCKTFENKMRLFLHEDEGKQCFAVHGPTISAWAEDSLYFNDTGRWGEDVEWEQRMVLNGATIASTSKYNFMLNRNKGQNHTWVVDDTQIAMLLGFHKFDITEFDYDLDIVEGKEITDSVKVIPEDWVIEKDPSYLYLENTQGDFFERMKGFDFESITH